MHMIKQYFLKFVLLALLMVCSKFNAQAQSNQYLHFDGQNDYVSFANAAAPLNGSNTISMAGWFYTDALNYGQGMMSIRGGGTGTGEMYIIQLSNGILECRVQTTTGLKEFVAPAGTVQAGTWQHIAWVFDADSVKLFINGSLLGGNVASGTFVSTDKPFTIGRCIISTLDFYFGGRADEVSLWKKALTEVEIQDMMANELLGTETDLVTYYKFNQGIPGGNNASITQLISETGPPQNATLLNFGLNGATSNFNGTLQSGFQAISFPEVGNKLITAPPFALQAISSSGLPITYTIESGPAIVSGSTLTLTGSAGDVTVKASQPGDATFNPAADQFVTFSVLDPAAVLVNTVVAHPLAGDVHAPNLIPLQLAIRADIPYPDLFSVQSVTATIDGTPVELLHHGNGYYIGWWTPGSYGNHNIVVTGTNNFNAQGTNSVSFNLVQSASNVVATATDQAWVNLNVAEVTVESDLPSYIGAYDQIIGKLQIGCPTGGCDPWDRVSHVEVQGKDGQWYEIIRYLTPYGVACNSQIDLTDFASLLLGKTKFRVTLGTQGNGFLYTLKLEYRAGAPTHPYSSVRKLWYGTYQFGDMANLQPAETINPLIPSNVQAGKIKLVATGHGWGNNNTGNAAEFKRNKHHIWVNGASTFEQDNWNTCNPNPDGCSPQFGTWQHNRAGWCPGSIAQFFNYDMTPHVGQSNVSLRYVFDESYVDLCHPNNPNCVSSTTCPDCNDGFNPHLITSAYFVTYANSPISVSVKKVPQLTEDFTMYPNPSSGKFVVELTNSSKTTSVAIYNIAGKLVKSIPVTAGTQKLSVDFGTAAAGVYIVSIKKNDVQIGVKRLVIE